MLKVYSIILLLSGLLVKCDSARILGVFPVPAVSHQYVFRALMQELAKRGHEVTVITGHSVFEKDQILNNNLTVIDLKYVAAEVKDKLLTEDINEIDDLFAQFMFTFKTATRLFEVLFYSKEVQNLIKDKNNRFDLLILEDCMKSTLIFSHIYKAPVILISSFGGTFATFETVGASVHPLIYPLAVRKKYIDLSIWEKFGELVSHYQLEKAYNDVEIQGNKKLSQYFGGNLPTYVELKNNVQMIFLNIHYIWDSNRPVPPNVIYLGGIHQKPVNELPKDLKSSLDSSVVGVIYMSFGTNVYSHLLSTENINLFLKVFASLPYDIYWKWNIKNLPDLPENVKVSDWFPQSDLLRHPKIKLFITQGGLQSVDESIAAGVPLIGIPMIWDQYFNVNKFVELGIGVHLHINMLTEENLKNAIQTVINDQGYYTNVTKLRSLMQDQPQPPLERAVWWTEHVLRQGARHLRAPAANMPWMEYYEIKLVAVVIICFLTLLLFSLSLICCLISKIKNYIKVKID